MPLVTLADGRTIRMSDVEAGRYARYRQRHDGVDDRREARKPARGLSSRRSMRDMVRWSNRKQTGHYGG